MEIRSILETHYTTIPHTKERKAQEMDFFYDLFKFSSRKWVFDILWELEINSSLGYNELSSKLGNISSRLLSDRLKELKRKKLIDREGIGTTPPTVNYSLTDKGKRFVELSMLLVWHLTDLSK